MAWSRNRFVPLVEALADRLTPGLIAPTGSADAEFVPSRFVLYERVGEQEEGHLRVAAQHGLADGHVFAIWITVGTFDSTDGSVVVDPYGFTREGRSGGV